MGALHEGHLSLVHRSKQENEHTSLSIFVNPTQFGPHEDFSKYPRPIERDLQMAEQAGVDAVFLPSVDEMYGSATTMVKAGSASLRWEGERRPGHFDGVATVVAKLFNIVVPDRAYFGQKDFQQCAVIRQLVDDLKIPVEIVECPTLREQDGLAMSSRNVYLSEQERRVAPMLYALLVKTAERIRTGEPIEPALLSSVDSLQTSGFDVDYFEFVDRSTLEPLREHNRAGQLILAARLGSTRLIDNLPV